MESLEALENLSEIVSLALCEIPMELDFNTDEARITIENELKALEIIKNKRVDILHFMISVDVNWYNSNWAHMSKDCLTQEEFTLLKEILK